MADVPGDHDNEELRLLRAAVARQRQILESKKKDMDLLEQRIRENLRHQDEVYLKLFPPVRPDRNPAHISSLIEEKSAELTHWQDAIRAQEGIVDASRESSDSGLSQDGDKSLTLLKRQCATTFANLEHLRSLLSPIRVLPVELLAEIFILSYDPMGTASLSNAALVVTHVCASWRNTAIHKSELWSSLKLGPGNFSTRPHGVIPLTQLWLERSGNRPLRLFVQPDDSPMDSLEPSPNDLFLQLVRLYTPHFARWKDLFFQYPRFDGTQELFSDIPPYASLPLLESFGIISRNIAIEDWVNFPRLLSRAPQLERLTWITKSSARDPPFIYSQLTRLVLGANYSLKNALKILSHAKRLQILDITVFIKSTSFATDFAHVVNESLQELTLSCAGDSSVLFDSLTLPALQELHVTKTNSFEITPNQSMWSGRSFVQFLCRSKCYLTGLGIADYGISPDEVLALLRHLSPSLISFEIDGFQPEVRPITDEILTALTYPADDPLAAISPDADASPPILCPLLRELRIVGCLSSTDGVLARMVESRWRPPPGLTRLRRGMFGLDSTKSPQDNARILALNGRRKNYLTLDVTRV